MSDCKHCKPIGGSEESIRGRKKPPPSVPLKRLLDCPHCHGKQTVTVTLDEHGCARWATCRQCGGDGPAVAGTLHRPCSAEDRT